MKKLLSLLLAFTILLSLCGCQGNFGSVNLNEDIAIPDNGIIEESTIQKIKSENAIGVFTGQSNGLRYEWTVFGSDIEQTQQINLGVELSKSSDGNIQIVLQQTRAFGFSALLSIYLDAHWMAQSATAYAGTQAIGSVSITGSKNTVLNLTLDGSVGNLEIRPDELPEDAYFPETETTAAETTPTSGKAHRA